MEMLEILGAKAGITENDVKIIVDIIDALPKNSIEANQNILERLFLSDIKPGHYIALGFLMGVTRATHEVCAMYENNLKPCQRQN